MPKTFNCNKCKGVHQRPINSRCLRVNSDISDTSDNETQDTNKLILQELKSLSGRTPLCKMENKIDWSETQKIDRVRRVHAQRSSHNYHVKSKASKNPITCKFFQKGSCHQKTDHEINGQMYLHVCQNCFQQGKSHPHPAKDCRTRSKNE